MVGAVLVCLAVFFVIGGLTAALVGWAGGHLLRRMRQAARPALTDLQHLGSLPRWILVTGQVVPGPEGILTSPAFDTRCVWYRTDVRINGDAAEGVPNGVPVGTLSAGGSTINVGDGTVSVQVDVELVLGSPRCHGPERPPEVPGRGSYISIERMRREHVLLRRGVPPPAGSALARLERAESVPRRAYPRFGSHGVGIYEVTIAPGVELSVLARPRRRGPGTVVLRRGTATVGSPQEWISREEEVAVSALGMAPVLIGVGLVLLVLGAALLWLLTGWPSLDY